jgi:Mg-chelatase subunit ChlD
VSGSRRVLDFCVSVRFKATDAQLVEIRRAFSEGSAVLADATDGQFEFGTVTIVNESGSSDEAEAWIMPGAGRAFATVLGYGWRGYHATLFYESDFSKVESATGDAITIVHEFLHLAWGLLDEYTDRSMGPTNAECEPPPGSTTATYCLMDRPHRRGGNRDRTPTGPWNFTVNELCVRGNHDPDGNTMQEKLNHKSCWETLASNPTTLVAVAPANLPVDAPPAVSPPVFNVGAQQRRFVLLIDRSGSMTEHEAGALGPDRLTLAKQAATVLIEYVRRNDQIAVLSFSSSASRDMELTTVTDAAVKQQAANAIKGLTAGGDTAIGDALESARWMLTVGPTSCCSQYVMLITDGENNMGISEVSTIPALRAAAISVFTVGIGRAVNHTNLAAIAGRTWGRYFHVANSADLPSLLAALSAEASGRGLVALKPGSIAVGQTVLHSIPVDESARELIVAITTDPSTDVAIGLQSPDGVAYTSTTGTDVEFTEFEGTRIAIIRRPTLVTGTYEVRVTGRAVSNPAYQLTAAVDSPGVGIVAAPEEPETTFPTAAKLSATFNYVFPVLDATVRARVVGPKGREFAVDLFDDGLDAHGDAVAGDGRYGALFGDYADGAGPYRVTVVAESTPGARTVPGESLFADAPSNDGPVPELHRETTFSIVVKGVALADFDGDGMIDAWEAAHGLSPVSTQGVDGAAGDPDGDGASNLDESRQGTNPFMPNTWVLSEGATGFFTERLAVANPFADEARFRVTYLTEGGAPILRDYTLSGQRRMTIPVNEFPGLSNAAVSAVITANAGGVAVERTMIWDARDYSLYGGHTGKALQSARTEWFLAEGEARFFDTYILLANASTRAATVTATFLLDSGEPLIRTYTVPAESRFTIWANGIEGVSQHAFSTTLRSDVPITAERAMYFTTDSRDWTGGHASAAVAAPSTSWFVAEGRTGSLFDMYLLLANPGTKATTAQIRFLLPGSGVITRDYALPPTSRTTVYVDGITGLEDTDVSAAITSGEPIIVERAMYWPDPFPRWVEAHNSAGVTELGTEWVLAEGEHGGPRSFATYILLANPGSKDALVTVEILRDVASPIAVTRVVPANARLTLYSGEIPGLGTREQFGAHIVSDQPIVVERAMYWNALGQFWGGGTNESGVRVR